MANKYANLVGTNKIKDEYSKINTGFDKVEADINDANSRITAVNNRVDKIITTPIDGAAAAQEIVDARAGFSTIGGRMTKIEENITTHKADNVQEFTDRGINVKWYGAVGDGIADDTQAFLDAIAACHTQKKALIIPRSSVEYKISGEILINKLVDIIMDPQAVIKFYPAAIDSVLFNIKTHPTSGLNYGKYEFGILRSNAVGQGIAVQIDSCNTKNVFVHGIQDFDTGIKLTTSVYTCLDNTIRFDLITGCTTGLYLDSISAYAMEGNKFDFNFITGCQYGIKHTRMDSGSIALNVFNGVAIHCTKENGCCLWFGGNGFVFENEYNINFLGADGANSLTIGGDVTINSETGFAKAKNNTFKVLIANPTTAYVKFAAINHITNLRNRQSHHRLETGYTPVYPEGEASFNGGNPITNNVALFSVKLPAAAAGTSINRFCYHQFCGGLKTIQVVPVYLANIDNFRILAYDNSSVHNREIVINIKYLATTTETQTIKFYLIIN